MAGKVTLPSAQAFSSDPLEQIMARGVMDRDMSGLAYMFLNAFGDRRKMDQQAYMTGLGESNQVAQQIAEMEARQKQQEEFLKSATKLAEMGNLPSSMPILQEVFRGGTTDMDQGGKLNQDLIRSKIASNNRDPNGGGGVQVSADVGPAGAGFYNFKGKGAGAQDAVNAAIVAHMKNMPQVPQSSVVDAEKMRARRTYGAGVAE
jgi:hypothetical protein